MIALLTLTLLLKSVLPSPVTPSALEHDDVKVMKCVAEALADVLSRPRLLPVSHQCLQTLRTDELLLTLLHHYDFLKELQDVADQDGSMLNALGGPGERSVLSQERRRSREEEEKDEDEDEDEGGEVGRVSPAAGKTEEDRKAWGPEEIRRRGSKEEQDKRWEEEDEEEEEEEEDEEEGMKKRSKGPPPREETEGEEEEEEEAPHHSKEASEEKDEPNKKRNRSPEEKELQMIARRTPDEEDGSAGRKAEKMQVLFGRLERIDGEAENLAAIESELENVAQKLHQLRRG